QRPLPSMTTATWFGTSSGGMTGGVAPSASGSGARTLGSSLPRPRRRNITGFSFAVPDVGDSLSPSGHLPRALVVRGGRIGPFQRGGQFRGAFPDHFRNHALDQGQ